MRLRLFVAVMLFAAGAIAWPPWGNRTGWNPVDSWHGDVDLVKPTFDLNFSDGSGPSGLSNSLSLNSTAMTLVAAYDARDAGGTWAPVSGGTGPTLTRSAGSTTLNRTPIFTEAAARRANVSANSIRYNSGSDLTTGNIGAAEDFVIEVVGCMSESGASTYHASKDNGGTLVGDSGGWWVGMTTGFDIQIGDGTTTLSFTVSSPPAVAGACYHVMVFGDHDEATASQSLVTIINGFSTTASGALSTLGAIGGSGFSLTLANLGSGNSGATDGGPISVRMWTCAACMAGGASNPTQWQAAADERLHRLAGTYLDVGVGQAYPTTFTRASMATVSADLDGDGIRRMARVGNGWPRVGRVPDSGSTPRTGYFAEEQRTNITLRSEEVDNASWTKTNGAITANNIAAPDGFSTADGFDSNNGAGSVAHRISQTQTLTAASWTCSGFFKAGTQPSILIRNGTANHGGCANVSTCTASGTYEGSPTMRLDSFGDGWCRVGMTHTATAAASSINYYISDDPDSCAPGDENYDDGTNSTIEMYFWGLTCEAGSGMSSYIPTTTASATRVQDVLQYSPTSHVLSAQGTDEVQVLCRGGTTVNPRLFYVSDGSTNVFGHPDTGTPNNFWYQTGGVSQASIGTSLSGINDNVVRTLRGYWNTNDARAWLNGTEDGTDASVTTYSNGTATRIAILNNGASSPSTTNTCYMLRARVWNQLVLR